MSTNDDWEDVDVPRGAYIGWGDHTKQHVTGEVIEYSHDGGTDFDGKPCPQLQVILTDKAASFNKKGERTDYDAGTLVVLNCGLVSLKRAVRAADLNTGDLVKLTLANLVDVGKGSPVKEFKIQRKRGNGQLSSNAERAMASAASAPPDQGGAWAAQDDEPPF